MRSLAGVRPIGAVILVEREVLFEVFIDRI